MLIHPHFNFLCTDTYCRMLEIPKPTGAARLDVSSCNTNKMLMHTNSNSKGVYGASLEAFYNCQGIRGTENLGLESSSGALCQRRKRNPLEYTSNPLIFIIKGGRRERAPWGESKTQTAHPCELCGVLLDGDAACWVSSSATAPPCPTHGRCLSFPPVHQESKQVPLPEPSKPRQEVT